MADAQLNVVDRNTHFVFEHKVFGLDGSYFTTDRDTGKAKFHMPLGDILAAVTIPSLKLEFGITEDSGDGALLRIVERSLSHVRAIRPNDSIPREVLDGTASWSVEARHHELARGRLSVQLAAWLTGGVGVVSDPEMLEQVVEDPATKERVEKALDKLADELELEGDRRTEVVNWIEHLADEFAYIEGLRDYYRRIVLIDERIAAVIRQFRRDQTMCEECMRVRVLIKKPLEDYANRFDRLDESTSEVLSIVKNIDDTVKKIRATRDSLHYDFTLWGELLEKWEQCKGGERELIDRLVRESYRFMAQNFQQSHDWQLGNF